ncbi:hypothetical protein AQS8620_00239 [Aquimixticola soesokkakensis]|uniref:Lipoprotein n=1 Tax=Aquimixticola soesokkakensis TaxID=1519096 RepID=A0A1Y5RD31_9RHOB|nr:hypothetical protein [Aquimixticola soesokkakensis]SLN14699.1 hypothetical protein AQS8620_00239 [Aquimixticola soesokkakensis]
MKQIFARMTRGAVVVALVALSGCIDAEVGMEFETGNRIVARMDMLMERQLFDMAGEAPDTACAQGRWNLTDSYFSCSGERVLTMAEATKPAPIQTQRATIDPAQAVQVEQLSPTQARVTVDFARILSERPEVLMPPASGDMRATIHQRLLGHAFVFQVRGSRVVQTSGEISADGRSARYTFPAERLLDRAGTPIAPFVTVIEFPPA